MAEKSVLSLQVLAILGQIKALTPDNFTNLLSKLITTEITYEMESRSCFVITITETGKKPIEFSGNVKYILYDARIAALLLAPMGNCGTQLIRRDDGSCQVWYSGYPFGYILERKAALLLLSKFKELLTKANDVMHEIPGYRLEGLWGYDKKIEDISKFESLFDDEVYKTCGTKYSYPR